MTTSFYYCISFFSVFPALYSPYFLFNIDSTPLRKQQNEPVQYVMHLVFPVKPLAETPRCCFYYHYLQMLEEKSEGQKAMDWSPLSLVCLGHLC